MTVPAVRYRVVALHGFFGGPTDWEPLRSGVPSASWQTLDLWTLLDARAPGDWTALGAVLAQELASLRAQDPALPTFLVAYSFGARLSLSIPEPGPTPAVEGACFVSCNPGFADDAAELRAERRQADEVWARRILEDDETDVLRDWDAQGVFAGSRPKRRVSHFPASRRLLARVMRTFSLGGQPDFRPRLRKWKTPLLWVAGEADPKFSTIAREAAHVRVPGEFFICEGAGHRVPWDAPEAFSRTLTGWIERQLAGSANE